MQETEYKQDANTLHVTFKPCYNNEQEVTSREFILCGLVTVQLKTAPNYKYGSSVFDIQIFHITTTKIFESDPIPYMIEIFSVALQLNEQNFIVHPKSSKPRWYILDKAKNKLLEFDIKVILKIDISPSTNTAFSLLYEDTNLTDFELRSQDGTVKVHKAVLASISPVMKTMLSGKNWKEASSGAVEIPNTTKETLQQLKDYMYLKKLPESGLEKLAALACYYMMDGFEELCTAKLLLTLTKDNVEELTDFAVEYRMSKMKIAIMLAIKQGDIDVTDLITKVDSEIKMQLQINSVRAPNFYGCRVESPDRSEEETYSSREFKKKGKKNKKNIKTFHERCT